MCFTNDLERGRVGEELVTTYFRNQGYEIADASNDGEYFDKDIDLIVADSIAYEVKTDYRYPTTGNLALESKVTTALGKRKGWLWDSEADYFAFVNPRNKSCFITIKADTLRHIAKNESLKKAYHFDGETKTVELLLIKPKEHQEFFQIHYTEKN